MRRFVFYPRANAHGAIVSLDVRVVVARLRFGGDQIAIDRRWNLDISINGAVCEFDFEQVSAFAIAHLRDTTRLNALARNVRSDCGRAFGILRFGIQCPANANEKCKKKTARTLHGAES